MTCTALDRFHCKSCAAEYFLQHDAQVCLNYCGSIGFLTDGAACSRTGDVRSALTFNSLPTVTTTGFPRPACDRGYYFTDNYIQADEVLHGSTYFDAWIRSTDLSGTHTIYSRNKPSNANSGDENGITLYVDNGYLKFEVY